MTFARTGHPTSLADLRPAPTMAFVGGFPAGVAAAAATAPSTTTTRRCRSAFAGVAVAVPFPPSPASHGVVTSPLSLRAMAGRGRAEREPGGGGRKQRGGGGAGGGVAGGGAGGGDGVNSTAGGDTATTNTTCIEVDGVVQASLSNAASRVKLANDDSVLLAGTNGKIGSPSDDFLSSIGTSKSQSVTTLEPECTERSFGTVLQELAAIQADGPRNVAIIGTRHASYLHQQIIELLTYANVLVGNHVFTSGAAGTNYAVIKGALRAEKPDLLTVVLPQSMRRQPAESQTQVAHVVLYMISPGWGTYSCVQEMLKKVKHVVELSKNDSLPLDYASQLCNSDILSSLESAREAKALGKVATLMYLD